jgi:hypothetical protein
MNVLHVNDLRADTAGTVYIGRWSKWGNPYRIGIHGDRSAVIAKFEAYIRARPKLMAAVRKELKGRALVCHCAPLPCHGDVLARIVEEEEL